MARATVFWRYLGTSNHGALSIWYDGALSRAPGTPGTVGDDGWQIVATLLFDPTYRVIPKVIGQELAEAIANLAAAGFRTIWTYKVDPMCNNIHHVMEENPIGRSRHSTARRSRSCWARSHRAPCP